MNKRLKLIRSYEELTQREFCKKLHISQGLYGQMETGQRKITERALKDICRVYHVNEHWFRTGQGKMLDNDTDNAVLKLSKEYNLDKLAQSILKISLQLTDEQKELIYELAKKLVDDYEK